MGDLDRGLGGCASVGPGKPGLACLGGLALDMDLIDLTCLVDKQDKKDMVLALAYGDGDGDGDGATAMARYGGQGRLDLWVSILTPT